MYEKEIQGFKKELAKVEKWKREAWDRMKRQSAAGDLEKANLSRKAYEFSCKYAKQLEHIIDGYQHQNSGKLFTKDASPGERYVDSPKYDVKTVHALRKADKYLKGEK